MNNINTHWSTPKTNLFAAINSLRKALISGQNAVLIKMRNEDCKYPIIQKHDDNTKTYWYDHFVSKSNNQFTPKQYKHKLWVVQLLKTNEPKPNNSKSFNSIIKIINLLSYPLMYIPKKTTLQMPTYKLITFRLGSLTNGYKIEFQLPKKFNLKDK